MGKSTNYVKSLFLAAVLYFLIVPRAVFAYLDVGTGSYVVQFLIGILAGGVFLVKTFWFKIAAFMKKIINIFKARKSGKSENILEKKDK